MTFGKGWQKRVCVCRLGLVDGYQKAPPPVSALLWSCRILATGEAHVPVILCDCRCARWHMGQTVFSLTRTCASACHPEHTLPLTRPASSEGRSSGLVTMVDMVVSGGSHQRYAGCFIQRHGGGSASRCRRWGLGVRMCVCIRVLNTSLRRFYVHCSMGVKCDERALCHPIWKSGPLFADNMTYL
jgi:hypothetical protein